MDPPQVVLHVYDPFIPEGLSKAFVEACQGTQLVATPVALLSSAPMSQTHRVFLMPSCRSGCRFPAAAE